jgi:hypothetical protein
MTSRLAPVVGITLLAAAASFAGRASAAPCTPVRIERPDAAMPLEWSRAMTELMEATSVEGQAWSCTGGVLGVVMDPSDSSATLTLTDASGRRVERRIPRALDLVPSAKALLAAPAVEIAPAPTPPAEAEMKHPEPLPLAPAPLATTPPAEPRFFVDALLGARYRRPENAIWGAATVRAMIPFGAWSGGFWLRGAIPASLEHKGKHDNHTSSEATLGVSGGRRLIDGPFQLHVTIDPSITFAFEPSASNPPGQPGPHDDLTVRIHPQIGLGLRGSFPIAGPLRGSVALDGEFLPKTIGAGLSLGIEAVIR